MLRAPPPSSDAMLRAEVTAEGLHARQADCLPGRFGLRVTKIAEGALDAEVALEPWMLAPNGFLHAASVLLLADTASGYACMAHLPEGAKNFTTIELKSNFLASTRDGTIRTECRAEHLGRTTHVWSATVFGQGDRRLALFRCTQMILW
jgi:1,4-dihydroxy-2-naphthoyl-CoA hydrolase